MGSVITFYSYKGGVGRSMALANLAVLLTSWGKKVLMIDWDLEAPGLENYFKDLIRVDFTQREGLINILSRRREKTDYEVSQIEWDKILVNIPIPTDLMLSVPGRLDLLTAGQKGPTYIQLVRKLDYDKFYDEQQGGEFLENLREYWIGRYDFVLIDSRTGLTDSSGVCSIQMPDILVLLFTATEQGFRGTLDVARIAAAAQQDLIYDRFKLKLLAVPTRFDSTEFKLQQEWLSRFTVGLQEVFTTWVPDYPDDDEINISHRELLDLTKLPYIPYFSFGEKLPVIEHGTKDPQGLGYAYETIAALLTHKLEGAKMLVENRGEFVRRAKEGVQPYEKEGVQPYEEVPELNSSAAPVVKTQSRLMQVVKVLGFVAFVIVTIYLSRTINLQSSRINSDSLAYVSKVNEFIDYYKKADTSDISSVLELKKSLFSKRLQQDTSRAIRKIKSSIGRILKSELEFDLPLIYQDIAQSKFNPHKYYADTIKEFINYKNITINKLDSTTNFFKVKGYNNTIENDLINSFSFDSVGYTVKYMEVGNFTPSVDTYVRVENKIKLPVTVNLNNNFKLVGLTYGKIEKSKAQFAKSRIRVDIFAVGEMLSLQIFLTESIYEELQHSINYLPRKKILPDSVNNLPNFKITENEIRYSKGEERYAYEIQSLISKSTGQKFYLHRVEAITRDYLSVFIYGSPDFKKK